MEHVRLVVGEDYRLRPGKASDHSIVLDSWIKSHRRNCYPDRLDQFSYHKGQEWLVKALLERCALYVACDPRDEDLIFGWTVTSANCVHYAWVRHRWRRRGIAAEMLKPYMSQPTIYTHPISVGADWMTGKWDVPKNFTFDPFHAYRIAAYPKPRDNV
jgi:GNAT superfamily N-acetyltransferase